MSTKIYEAYRIPASKLAPFLIFIREETIKKAIPAIQTMMNAIKPEVMAELESRFGVTEEGKKSKNWPKQELGLRWEFLYEKFKEYYKQIEYHPFDVQSGLTIFPDGRYFYYWPWGRFQAGKEIVLRFEGVKDFCYWNNTDRPDDVSSREWNRRERRWNQLHDQRDSARLTYYILDFSPGAYRSCFEIETALGLHGQKTNQLQEQSHE